MWRRQRVIDGVLACQARHNNRLEGGALAWLVSCPIISREGKFSGVNLFAYFRSGSGLGGLRSRVSALGDIRGRAESAVMGREWSFRDDVPGIVSRYGSFNRFGEPLGRDFRDDPMELV